VSDRADPPAMPSAASDARPGPLAWVVIVAGWSLMGWVLAGVLREADRTHPGSWVTWVVGAALVHDLVVLPVVLLVGFGFSAAVTSTTRGPLRAAVTVVVIVGLVSWPTVARFGARSDNPSILPIPAGRNLAILSGAMIVAAFVIAWIRARQGRRVQ